MGDAPDKTEYRFDANGWTDHGDIGGVQAYSRANQVVCVQPNQFPFIDEIKVSVLAGAKTKKNLKLIADQLGVKLT
jgi:hypothetical protein